MFSYKLFNVEKKYANKLLIIYKLFIDSGMPIIRKNIEWTLVF